MNDFYNFFKGLNPWVQAVGFLGTCGVAAVAVNAFPKVADAFAKSGSKIDITNNGWSLGPQETPLEAKVVVSEAKPELKEPEKEKAQQLS